MLVAIGMVTLPNAIGQHLLYCHWVRIREGMDGGRKGERGAGDGGRRIRSGEEERE